MGEPQYLRYPLLPLAQSVFTLAAPSTSQQEKQASLTSLQDAIREHKMAPLYAYLAHPQTGKINGSGEGGSGIAAMSPTLSRSNTAGSSSGAPPAHLLRRTSSINAPSIVGVLGGKKDSSVELPWDESLYNQLKDDNEKELTDIAKEEETAAETAGDTEVQAAQAKRAEFYARIGDKDRAIAEFEKLLEKTGILATKIDIALAMIRITLFFDDKQSTKALISRAQTLVESGGDWDRRNRLKAYQGLHLLTIRAYNLAAPLLLDSLSTFTSTELCPYSSLVVYATLAGAVSLPRREFKTKVVDAPEIRAVFGAVIDTDRLLALSGKAPGDEPEEMAVDDSLNKGGEKGLKDATTTPKPTAVNLTTLASGSASADAQALAEPKYDFQPLATMIQSLYHGNYAAFFQALAKTETNFLAKDRYLYEHKHYFVREMRLRAYSQLLASYKVVSLSSMASSFGVSIDWLDRDLAPFIAGGRLQCMVDRVKGVVEMRNVDSEGGYGSKGAQYQELVRQGDQLITKLQKYGQVVRLRGSERS